MEIAKVEWKQYTGRLSETDVPDGIYFYCKGSTPTSAVRTLTAYRVDSSNRGNFAGTCWLAGPINDQLPKLARKVPVYKWDCPECQKENPTDSTVKGNVRCQGCGKSFALV